MSLLLDALKQAEETKKQAAAKQHVEAVTEAPGLQLEDAVVELEPTLIETQEQSQEPAGGDEIELEPAPELEPIIKQAVEAKPRKQEGTAELIPNVLSVGKKQKIKSNKKPVLLLSLLSVVAAAVIFMMYGVDGFSGKTIQYKPYNKKPAGVEAAVVESVETRQVAVVTPAIIELDTTESTDNLAEQIQVEVAIKPEPKQMVVDDPAAIKIKKRQTPSRISRQLSAAYQSLQQGDYQKAESEYVQVLAKDPKQIVALLGMANIESNRANMIEARRLYESVLVLDQMNTIAQIGLMYTYQQDSPAEKEKILNEMLDSAPDNANIHAELGHALAAQSKWNAAQKSYFKAFSLDQNNAIYAYNLAVSLDQLEKPNAAISYYQKTLSLSNVRQPFISLEQVRNRLQELGQ